MITENKFFLIVFMCTNLLVNHVNLNLVVKGVTFIMRKHCYC